MSEENDLCDVESIDNRLDVVLVTALRENFEIKEGFHVDRNEILEFLRSVVEKHSDLEFVLHHRDTKLSGRIYKAFPKVTTKRVAVPNERGKKTWRYTNLRKTVPVTEVKQDMASDDKSSNNVKKVETTENVSDAAEKLPNEQKRSKSERSATIEEYYNTSRLDWTADQDFDPTTDLNFSAMLKWIKDHYVLDEASSVQVKCIVDGLKEAFHTDITYKQTHKLVYSVFPGASSRVVHPVRLEVRGSFYSYRGIAPKTKQGKSTQEQPNQRFKASKSKCRRSKQTWIPPVGVVETRVENRKSKVKQTRQRFLQSCAALKDNLDTLQSIRSHKALPAVSELAAIEKESSLQRMVEELKQERDQAIVERNQAMVSLMELEKQTDSRITEVTTRPPTVVQDDGVSVAGQPCAVTPALQVKAEGWPEGESRDWLRSLINRSNHILGEQMSEANSKYFPGLTLQSSPSPNQTKQTRLTGVPGEFIEMERYEKLKNERDQIWKSWMEKMKREKEDIIQQLKLEKMEVIQKMELEKSDAIDSIQEKLSNQVTILTRELRELKELLNHTMNERTLAIEYAQKLMKLVDEKILKKEGLDSFPFDEIQEHHVHRPRQVSSDESESQKMTLPLGKGNKRKQSMPAKLKKIQKTSNSSTCVDSEKNGETMTECVKYVETGDERDKYYSGTGDLSYCDDKNGSPRTVSSIDCLNSIVEKIGRPDTEESATKPSGKMERDLKEMLNN